MNEKNALIELFETINEANNRAGYVFQVIRLNPLLSLLQSGDFFNLPYKEQVFRLATQCEDYVGKGEIIWGLIDHGWLPEDFPKKMQITIWLYFLSLDLPETSKEFYKEQLARILKL